MRSNVATSRLRTISTSPPALAPTSRFVASQRLPRRVPAHISQGDVEQLVGNLHTQGKLAGFDLSTTVFNFMLPHGTVLNDNPAPNGTQGVHGTQHRRGVPSEEEADSLSGLGGYHGSVQTGGTTRPSKPGRDRDDVISGRSSRR